MGRKDTLGRDRHTGGPSEGKGPWSHITYREVLKKLGSPLPIWEYFFLRYIYGFLIYLDINIFHLHPNIISLLSMASAIWGVYAFWHGNFVLGALLFELAFIFDCVDGPVARITGQTSKLGVALEVWTDSIRLVGSMWALVHGLGNDYMLYGMIYSISFGAGVWLYTKSVESAMKGGETINKFISSGPFWKIPTWVELETLGFFLLPLLGKPLWGLYALAILHPIMTLIMTVHGVVTGER